MPTHNSNKPGKRMYVFYNNVTRERFHSMERTPPSVIRYDQVFEYELKDIFNIKLTYEKKGA